MDHIFACYEEEVQVTKKTSLQEEEIGSLQIFEVTGGKESFSRGTDSGVLSR